MSQPLEDGEEEGNGLAVLAGSTQSGETPFNTLPGEFRSALEEFRDNWQRELSRGQQQTQTQPTNRHLESQEGDSVEGEQQQPATLLLAANLFRCAVELEQRGKVYDALPLYRKALHLVPDIERRFYELQNVKSQLDGQGGAAVAGGKGPTADGTDDAAALNGGGSEAGELIADLYEKFRLDLARDDGGKLLLSSRDAAVIATELHISDLPPELLLYILRWVVSTQLDLRSLEQCAAVSKGMYLCARDDDIWRLACLKVWGDEVVPPLRGSWRQMYLTRERVLFNGCYVSKTTYLRMGENSFQDQFYRPVQLVEYYRYARFLPDGSVLMMTTADEPAQGVGKLKNLQQLRGDVLRGRYRLFGNTVSIVLQKQAALEKQQQQRYQGVGGGGGRQRRGSSAFIDTPTSANYCIELRIMGTRKRRCMQLHWLHYSIEQTRNKVATATEFDLVPSKYPPFYFSPVRSYHLDADAPLS